jgi:hypothetical protein
VYGPGGVPLLTITARQLVKGPDLPNWQPDAILASLDEPLQWRGEEVRYVAFNPRYTSQTMSSVAREGGVVGVSRIRPGHDPQEWTHLIPDALEYWGVGVLRVLEA